MGFVSFTAIMLEVTEAEGRGEVERPKTGGGP